MAALIPSDALDAQLFDDICEEQAREVADFHRELREKFNWAGQNPKGFDPDDVRISGNANVPTLRPDGPTYRYR